jgi:tetratricopeptide (TPR) repeat protein
MNRLAVSALIVIALVFIPSCRKAKPMAPPKGNAATTQSKTSAEWNPMMEAAIKDYTEKIRRNPSDAKAWESLGNCHAQCGKLELAITEYNQSLRLKPDVWVYLYLGDAYQAMGKNQQADETYRKALKLKPDFGYAYERCGNNYAAQGKYQDAIKECTSAIGKVNVPDEADIYESRAISYFRIKEYGKAWADVKMCRTRGGKPNTAFVKELTTASGHSE